MGIIWEILKILKPRRIPGQLHQCSGGETEALGFLKNFSDDPTIQPILNITSLDFYSYLASIFPLFDRKCLLYTLYWMFEISKEAFVLRHNERRSVYDLRLIRRVLRMSLFFIQHQEMITPTEQILKGQREEK